MGARLRSWWQKARKPIDVIGFVVVLVAAGGLIFIEVRVYGTGFTGKTLWDWLQLLLIPVMLAAAGFWFNHRERKAAELRADNERKAAELRAEAEREIEQQRVKAEREIALDNQREASLQAYINEMSELLLHENLRESKPGNEVRKIARVRTLTVLPRLDGERKKSVLQFLYESELIKKDNTIVDLRVADLQSANLRKSRLDDACLNGANLNDANLYLVPLINTHLFGTYLRRANLRGAFFKYAALCYAFLEGADLSNAYLYGADLSGANLTGANFTEANLTEANFENAFLMKAKVTDEQLNKAKSLKGATMPDGSIHP